MSKGQNETFERLKRAPYSELHNVFVTAFWDAFRDRRKRTLEEQPELAAKTCEAHGWTLEEYVKETNRIKGEKQ